MSLASADDLYRSANEHLLIDDFDKAISLYTQAIELSEDEKPEYFLKRSNAYQKVGKSAEALEDAETVLKIARSRLSLKEEDTVVATAYLRRGIAAYALGDFTKAKESFDKAHAAQLEDVSLPIWIRKTNEELEKRQAESDKAVIAATSTPTASTTTTKATTPTPSRLRHDWYQNDSTVHLSVYVRNAPKDGSVKCEFTERTVSLTCPNTKTPGTEITFDLDPLSYEIDPTMSSHQVLTSKIDIKLMKKVAGIAWSKIEGVNTAPAATVSSVTDTGGKYPTSSRRGPKNWDVLAQDTEEDKSKAEGDDAINTLFQKIYRDADEDTRRAMMKSFQESNGTSLSTNWSEVGKGKVETQPPDGMIAKKYGQ